MTLVLAWKVYREQRLVWLSVAGLALTVLMVHVAILEPQLPRDVLAISFCLVAAMYGLIVGALLLAGEQEGGTAPFLETLPASQNALWGTKCLAAGGLLLAQVLYLWLVLLAARALPDPLTGAQVLLWLVGLVLQGFAWGLFFSSRTRTSIGAIGGAFLGQILAIIAIAFLEVMVFELLRWLRFWGLLNLIDPYRRWTPIGGCLLLSEVLLLLSWASHFHRDRLRRLPRIRTRERAEGDSPSGSSGTGWLGQLRVLIWLQRHQAGKLFLGLAIGALVGSILLPLSVLVWPVVTLLLGVVAGVAVFSGDQEEGTGRFLAEQRLPLGRAWAVRVALHLLLAVGIALLFLIPTAVRLGREPWFVNGRGWDVVNYRTTLEEYHRPTEFHRLAGFLEWPAYLTLFLGCGFSVGCLCGLLFRKPALAVGIGLSFGLLLAGLWLPSLLVGGLHLWQLWGVPVVLLVTSRLLVWPWATGQLGSTGAVVRLVGGLSLAALWMAGALWYRVIEVPLVPEQLDLEEFAQQLAAARQRESGPQIRTVQKQLGGLKKDCGKILTQLEGIPIRGWPAETLVSSPPANGGDSLDAQAIWKHVERQELMAFLDGAFGQPWAGHMAEAVRLPLGLVEDVRDLTLWKSDSVTLAGPFAAQLLVARGLQQQARGDPEDFVIHLATGLALVRHLRHLQPTDVLESAGYTEEILVEGVERWLERLNGRPDLLRRTLALLLEHDLARKQAAAERLQADYRQALNTINQPEAWVGSYLEQGKDGPHPREPLATLVTLAWQTPWEQARLQRSVRLLANVKNGTVALPGVLSWFPSPTRRSWAHDWFVQAWLEAHQLQVALRLYQAETGKPAATLNDLVPRLIPFLPIDPTTKEPRFGYRPSRGEQLQVLAVRRNLAGWVFVRKGSQLNWVPLNQGILFSKEVTLPVPPPPSPPVEGKEK